MFFVWLLWCVVERVLRVWVSFLKTIDHQAGDLALDPITVYRSVVGMCWPKWSNACSMLYHERPPPPPLFTLLPALRYALAPFTFPGFAIYLASFPASRTGPRKCSPLLLQTSAHTSAADFHLAQLSRLLLPTLTTRACMHAVLQTGADKGGRGAGGVTLGGVLGAGGDVKPSLDLGGAAARPRAGLRDVLEGKGKSLSARGVGWTTAGGVGVGVPPAEAEGGSVPVDGAATVSSGTAQPDAVGDGWVDMWGSLVDVLEVSELCWTK